MLRIWRGDCALCVIGNSFPCHQPHKPKANQRKGKPKGRFFWFAIPPSPSHEGIPHCAKEKNRSPFYGEKPLIK